VFVTSLSFFIPATLERYLRPYFAQSRVSFARVFSSSAESSGILPSDPVVSVCLHLLFSISGRIHSLPDAIPCWRIVLTRAAYLTLLVLVPLVSSLLLSAPRRIAFRLALLSFCNTYFHIWLSYFLALTLILRLPLPPPNVHPRFIGRGSTRYRWISFCRILQLDIAFIMVNLSLVIVRPSLFAFLFTLSFPSRHVELPLSSAYELTSILLAPPPSLCVYVHSSLERTPALFYLPHALLNDAIGPSQSFRCLYSTLL